MNSDITTALLIGLFIAIVFLAVGAIAFVMVRESVQRRRQWNAFASANGFEWVLNFNSELQIDLPEIAIFSGERLLVMFNNVMRKRITAGELFMFDYTYQTGRKMERKLHEHTVMLFTRSWVEFDGYAAESDNLQVIGLGKQVLIFSPKYVRMDEFGTFVEKGETLFEEAVQLLE